MPSCSLVTYLETSLNKALSASGEHFNDSKKSLSSNRTYFRVKVVIFNQNQYNLQDLPARLRSTARNVNAVQSYIPR